MGFDRRAIFEKINFTGRMKNYNLDALRKDIIAGAIVGVIAIPLALAFQLPQELSQSMVFIQLRLQVY